jgi:hypothetical protein
MAAMLNEIASLRAPKACKRLPGNCCLRGVEWPPFLRKNRQAGIAFRPPQPALGSRKTAVTSSIARPPTPFAEGIYAASFRQSRIFVAYREARQAQQTCGHPHTRWKGRSYGCIALPESLPDRFPQSVLLPLTYCGRVWEDADSFVLDGNTTVLKPFFK